jgi:acyl carrier protein
MVVTRNDIISAIESAGASVDISKINGSDSLRDAGLDSLDMMNFFMGIEEKYDVKISDEDLAALDTIDNIIAYMARF